MDTTFEFAQESKKLENLSVTYGYSACSIGDFIEIKNFVMENKDLGITIPSKLFLHKALNLTGAEISLNNLPAGIDYIAKHKHKENEEIVIVLSGNGYVLVDENEISVKEGSIVKIGTGKVRAIKSSKTNDLTYICIQVKENSLTNYTLTDAEML